jgi:hypothetical protein
MTVLSSDPMLTIADQVTYCLSQYGYAFVEDDKVEALADTLKSFLKTAGIPINEEEAAAHLARRRGAPFPTLHLKGPIARHYGSDAIPSRGTPPRLHRSPCPRRPAYAPPRVPVIARGVAAS